MDVDESEDEEQKMDVDDRQSLRDKLRQKKIDFKLGRIEGADP